MRTTQAVRFDKRERERERERKERKERKREKSFAEVIETGEKHGDVVCGFICQDRATAQPGLFNWTPGWSLDLS